MATAVVITNLVFMFRNVSLDHFEPLVLIIPAWSQGSLILPVFVQRVLSEEAYILQSPSSPLDGSPTIELRLLPVASIRFHNHNQNKPIDKNPKSKCT